MVLSWSKKSIFKRNNIKKTGDCCYFNCLLSFRRKNKLESLKSVFENKDYCDEMKPSDNTKMLEFNQNQKSDEASFIIYADLECFIE